MAIKIPRFPVQSSNLRELGYDGVKQILAVEFKSGDVYHYAGVPLEVWTEFRDALSLGSYYGLNIRGKYQGQKMTGECPKCGDKPGWIGDRCESCGCAEYVGPELHLLVWDHPSATSKRAQLAECGKYFRPSEFARNVDAVTCAGCKQVQAERESLSIE